MTDDARNLALRWNPDLICSYLADGSCGAASNASQVILACDPGLLEGEGLFERIHPGDAERFRAAITAALAGEPDRIAHRMVGADGAAIRVESVIGPAGPHGEPADAAVSSTRPRADADDAPDLERFAATVSHDLAQPLATLAGYVELLELDYEDALDDEGRRYLVKMSRAMLRLQGMVGSLLDYVRVGRTDVIEPAAVETLALAEGAIENLAVEVGRTGAQVSIAGGLPRVSGDGVLLTKAFQHLIAAAIRFGDPAGPVVGISAQADDQRAVFSIEGNGPGILADEAGRAFQMFAKLSAPDRTGLGIGIATAKSVIDRHGGEIRIERKPDGGSKFSFDIPGTPPGGGTAQASPGAGPDAG